MKKLYLLLLVTLLICGCGSTAKETETVSEVAVETEKVVTEVADTTESEVTEAEVAETEVVVENEHGPWDEWGAPGLSTETKKKLYYAGYVVRCQYTEGDGTYAYCILPYSVDRTCSIDEIDDLTEGMKNAFELTLEAFEIPLQLVSVGQTSIYQMYNDVHLCDLESTGCWGCDVDVMPNDTNKRRVITKDLELTTVDVTDPDAKFGYFPEFTCRAKE